MRNFEDIFETRKRTFFSCFSICMIVPSRVKTWRSPVSGKNCSLVSRFCTIMTNMILLKLHVWEKSLSRVKGATKLYFMHYSCVVIILFSTGLCKSAFSTYSFGKTRFSLFCFLVFHVSISLVFIFLFCVLNSMPFQNT